MQEEAACALQSQVIKRTAESAFSPTPPTPAPHIPAGSPTSTPYSFKANHSRFMVPSADIDSGADNVQSSFEKSTFSAAGLTESRLSMLMSPADEPTTPNPATPMSVSASNRSESKSPSLAPGGLIGTAAIRASQESNGMVDPMANQPDELLLLRNLIVEEQFSPFRNAYLVEKNWIDEFLAITEPVIPGPIDNGMLFVGADRIVRHDISVGTDFYCLGHETFENLKMRFGLPHDWHEICLPVCAGGDFRSALVDLRPVSIRISMPNCDFGLGPVDADFKFSRKMTFRDILFLIKKLLLVKGSTRDVKISRSSCSSVLPVFEADYDETLENVFDDFESENTIFYEISAAESPIAVHGNDDMEVKSPVSDDLPLLMQADGVTPALDDSGDSDSDEIDGAVALQRRETLEEKRMRVRQAQEGWPSADIYSAESRPDILMLEGREASDDITPVIPTMTPRPLNNSFSSSSISTRYQASLIENPIGATGLTNLGNTCFMNSALQCLSNTSSLTSFFLSEEWKKDLNTDNPLGMKGEVAEAYANLIDEIWQVSPNRPSAVPPRNFKYTIGRFNPTFVGYYQQDSQELLQFLLDGLHEDLNRIKKKPYVEVPDMEGMTDEAIAQKSWEIYSLRNDSSIVDRFQGEYKSRVECLDCHKWSVKFDPFMFLTVPIPDRELTSRTVIAVPAIRSQQNFADQIAGGMVRLMLKLPREASIELLKYKVAEHMGWHTDPKRSKVIEMNHSHQIHRFLQDYEMASELGDPDLYENFVYELCDPNWDLWETPSGDRRFEAVTFIPISLTHTQERQHHSSYSYSTRSSAFGPLVLIPAPRHVEFTSSFSEDVMRAALNVRQALETFFRSKVAKIIVTELCEYLGRFARFGLFRAVDDVDVRMETIYEALFRNEEGHGLLVEHDPLPLTFPPGALDPDFRHRIYKSYCSDKEVELIPTGFSLRILRRRGTSSFSRYGGPTDELLLDRDVKECTIQVARTEPDNMSEDNEYEVGFNRDISGMRPRIDEDISSEIRDDRHTRANDSSDEENEPSLKKPNYSRYRPSHEHNLKINREDVPLVDIGMAPGHVERFSLNLEEFADAEIQAELLEPVAQILFGREAINPEKEIYGVFRPPDRSIIPKEYARESLDGKVKTISLYDCLAEFMREEKMGEQDTWYCPNCKEHKRIKKKLDLWRVPENLVFHLKRFSNSGRGFRSMQANKITALVDFPVVGLDLTDLVICKAPRRPKSTAVVSTEDDNMNGPHGISASDLSVDEVAQDIQNDLEREAIRVAGSDVSPASGLFDAGHKDSDEEKHIYDLYAVSNHFGGLGGGHYTAYAKNALEDQWYNFDDSHVSKISESSIMTEAAYLLFYKRRSSKSNQELKNRVEDLKEKLANAPSSPPPRAGFSNYSFPGTGSRLGGGVSSAFASSIPFASGIPKSGSDETSLVLSSPDDDNVAEVADVGFTFARVDDVFRHSTPVPEDDTVHEIHLDSVEEHEARRSDEPVEVNLEPIDVQQSDRLGAQEGDEPLDGMESGNFILS